MEDIYKRAIDVYYDESKSYKEAYELFSNGAKKGDSRCIHMIGVMTFYGRGTEQDTEKAKQMLLNNINELEKAWAKHEEGSGELLAEAYSFDFLMNPKRRFEILEEIYTTKIDLKKNLHCDYADCFQFGKGTFVNKTKAQLLYKECYENYNSLYALSRMAFNVLHGYGSMRADIKKAIELYEEGFKQNSQYFFRDLIEIYCGIGFEHNSEVQKTINYKRAKELAQKYAEHYDSVEGKTWFAVASFLEGKENNLVDILNTIEINSYDDLSNIVSVWVWSLVYLESDNVKNIEFGNIAFFNYVLNSRFLRFYHCPCFWLSEFYRYQRTKTKNNELKKYYTDRYLRVLEEASRFADPMALGELYEVFKNGKLVPVNASKAFECIKKACDILEQTDKKKNYASLLNKLGECYEYGIGTNKDIDKAIECYKQSYLLKDDVNVGSIKGCFCYLFLCDKFGKISKDEINAATKYYLSNTTAYRIKSIWSNGKIDKNKDFFLAQLLYREEKNPSYLATCFIEGIGTEKDINYAIELLDKDETHNKNSSYYRIATIYLEEGKTDLAEQYFIKSNSDENLSYLRDSDIQLFRIYLDKNNDKYDLQKALDYLFNAIKEDKDNDSKLGEAFYTLGHFYQSKEHGMYNLNLAKKYYEKAKEHGLNCEYVIESVERDLLLEQYQEEGFAIGKQQNKFGRELTNFAREYARDKYASSTDKGLNNCVKRMLHTGVKGNERKIYITNELQDDFKELWDDLKDNAKQTLITAIFTYSNFVESGYECYADLDFSQVVNGVSKAFEIELKEFFSTGLLKYLLANDVDYEEFVNEATNTQVPFIDTRIEIKDGVPINYYSYSKTEESKSFSLGQVYFILTIGQNRNYFNGMLDQSKLRPGIKTRQAVLSGDTINPHIIDYFDELFSEDAFSGFHRREEIANYLIDLANDVKTIKNKRNPGAHDDVLTVDDAELCADYLVKIRHPIYDFLSKIKKEYRKGFYIKDTDC